MALAELVLYAPDYASVKVIRCSPPSWMAHAVLEEKGADYRVEWVSFAKGEHKTPAMLARNPRGTIPVLADGEASVHETLAILEYLDHRFPAPPLLPRTAVALTRFHESAAVKDKGMALFVALMKGEDASAAWRGFEEELAHWEHALTAHRYTAGEAITLADFCVFTYVATAQWLGLSLDDLPAVKRWADELTEHRSIAVTWPTTWR